MPKLVNMKIDPAKEKEKYAAKESTLVEQPRYPYGLCIHLDDDVMQRLGMKSLPEVGKPIMVHAMADVTSVSENEYSEPDGKTEKRQSVTIQITDLALTKPEDIPDTAKVLYQDK